MSIGVDVGIRHLAICGIDHENQKQPWLWEMVDLKNYVSVEKGLILVIDDWVRRLAAHPKGVESWTNVVIERQPRKCTRIQQSVQDWLFILFTDRLKHTKVKLVNAKKKFGSFADGMDLTTYTKRKKGAIEIVERIVDNWPEIKGKRDDLADAFLLANSCFSGKK
jgi:hypothetical protein